MSEAERRQDTGRQTDTVQGNLPPPTNQQSPPELDEAILKAARRAVRFHWLTRWLEKSPFSRVAGWQLLAGVTLGALVCVGIGRLLGDKPEAVPSGMIRAEDPHFSESAGEDVAARSPESWLSHIAALIRDRQVAEAQSQLQAFQQRYPDYGKAARQ